MKRVFVLAALVCSLLSLFGQDRPTDAGNRAQQHLWIEEGFSSLNNRLKGIEEAHDSLRQRQEKMMESIRGLTKDIEDLRRAQSTVNPNAVTQEQLKTLAADVQAIDDKRMKDSELVKKMLKDLRHDLLAPVPSATKSPTPPPATTASGDFSEYTVKPGDSLSKIVQEYNVELKAAGLPPITVADVKAANPDVDPNKIFVGKKIRLPQPVKK